MRHATHLHLAAEPFCVCVFSIFYFILRAPISEIASQTQKRNRHKQARFFRFLSSMSPTPPPPPRPRWKYDIKMLHVCVPGHLIYSLLTFPACWRERSKIWGCTDYNSNRHRLAAPSPGHPLHLLSLVGFSPHHHHHPSARRVSSNLEFACWGLGTGDKPIPFLFCCAPPSPSPRRLPGSRFYFFRLSVIFFCRVSLAAVCERGDIVKDREAV